MALADLFRPERINAALSNPATLIGLQLLAAGGPQAQQMSTGQRLAAAAQGFQQQTAQQQQLDHAAVLNQLRQLQMQQAQNEAKSADDLRQRMQDPAFAASLPEHSRRLAAAGATPEQVFRVYEMESRLEQARRQGEALQQHRAAQLGIQQQRADAYINRQGQLAAGGGGQPGAPAGPTAPSMRQTVDQPLANGMMQRFIYDHAAGGYVPFGQPFKRGAQGSDLLGSLGIGEDGQPAPDAGEQAGEQPKPWSELTTGGGRGAPAPQQMIPAEIDFNDAGIPIPRGHVAAPARQPVQQPAPMAAAGGGQARAQDDKAAAFAADLAQAQRLLQARPELRDEINRRLMQTYGRGL